MNNVTRRGSGILLPCLLLFLAGCATVDFEWPTDTRSEFAPGAHYSHERALRLLQEGRAPQARALIIDYLDAEPDDARARDLLRQIEEDPEEWLGTGHFTHVVQPGETLSGLAARYLEQGDRFFVLARYNDIAQPRAIESGQRLRIPTRFIDPAEVPPDELTTTEPPPAEVAYREAMAALEAGAPAAAARHLDRALDHDADHAAAHTERERLRDEIAPDLHREAVLRFRNQDLDAAIDLWEDVLILDPDYGRARDYRSRAVELRERLEGINDD